MFTSGGTITALLQLIVGVPPLKAFELNWQIVNTSLTRLKFRGEEVSGFLQQSRAPGTVEGAGTHHLSMSRPTATVPVAENPRRKE